MPFDYWLNNTKLWINVEHLGFDLWKEILESKFLLVQIFTFYLSHKSQIFWSEV